MSTSASRATPVRYIASVTVASTGREPASGTEHCSDMGSYRPARSPWHCSSLDVGRDPMSPSLRRNGPRLYLTAFMLSSRRRGALALWWRCGIYCGEWAVRGGGNPSELELLDCPPRLPSFTRALIVPLSRRSFPSRTWSQAHFFVLSIPLITSAVYLA
ncbi:hypothetical protein GY45DRAFT_827229 [Cubamyces sp. BRFM 1775]|nr:hypothetical protein GY45DRAFT_827229 [Cubamyces sp. BRFM 1775]